MKRIIAGFLLAAAAALVYAPGALTQSGSTVLFDGKNLDNFNKIGDATGASRTAPSSPTRATASS
jgi:hypothetical protein